MAQRNADLLKELEERLRFETLLADISARFVNLAPDQIDSEILETQRRVCECLGLDVSALWQWSVETPRVMMLTHLYRPLGGPPLPKRRYLNQYFPWCLQQLAAGKVVAVSTEEAPAEAARDQEVWRHYGIKSTLAFPLSAGGEPFIGVLSFDTMREERAWPEALLRRLQLVAQIFTNALLRKRADQALRDSEARLSLAAASADARVWELELSTGRIWTTERGREFYGLAPEEEFTFERFLSLVHPEDRERTRESVAQAMQSGRDLSLEYRIALPPGTFSWITARGRPYYKPSGEPDRLMGVSIDISDRKRLEEELQSRLREIEALKKQLEQENISLREEVKLLSPHAEIVAKSLAMRQVLARVEQVAPTDSTVLLTGETGTGKEVIARAIHNLSRRKARPLVTVNCASLPPTLIESELFGREKGAFTGAMSRMVGRFEVADGSTLFLDEIGDLPLELQAKLLRVLEEGRFERLGSTKPIRVDVRILAATNRDLEPEVQAGRFRKDVYYRLNVFPITIPPLRERPDDIPPLVWAFIRQFEKRMGKDIQSVPKRSLEALQRYSWPGNARELRNVIEHAMIVSPGATLEVRPPTPVVAERSNEARNLQEIERRHILSVLEETGWRVAGKSGAAELLGLKPTTLEARMKKLGVHRPKR
ncbi:MAG TPA: sigma 54-interacting transcriptional regulator [Syntrophobacteria bacterium]|nr:sigma 54-interacting transcriptional regulator [Syntrophobacteria bacterium]